MTHPHVVAAGAYAPCSVAALCHLDARSFRPGEPPGLLVLDLDERTRRAASLVAASAGVPVGLWVRVAVEASRRLCTTTAAPSGLTSGSVATATTMQEEVRADVSDEIAISWRRTTHIIGTGQKYAGSAEWRRSRLTRRICRAKVRCGEGSNVDVCVAPRAAVRLGPEFAWLAGEHTFGY
jgi:hypothetical protein